MASAIILAIAELEPVVEPLVVGGITALIHLLKGHKNPAAALAAAKFAVASTPDDADTNSPTLPDGSRNPYFVG